MRTRSQSRSRNNSHQREAIPAIIEPLRIEFPFLEDQFQEDPPSESPMADNRTMAQLLQAPTEGYEEAIVIPEITANNFELRHGLITLVQNKQFFRHDKEDPHAHIRYFNKITSTMRVPNVPSSSIKRMIFPFSLEGAARIWLEKEPPRSIPTWDDLVSKFINQFFPPSKTTNLRNEITRFQQRFDESFYEAWERAVTTAMTTILKQFQAIPTPASVKAVEEICVTCGGAHPYYQCLAADGNTFLEFQDNIQGYVQQPRLTPIRNIMASFFQMNTASTSGSGPLPGNTIANPKGELKAITTRSGIVLDGPSVPMPPSFINPEEDERVEETLTDLKLGEFTIKVPPPLVQKAKPPSQRNYMVHQRDSLHPNIPYPSRMHKQKQQEKDKVQIHKFWKMFKQLDININLADALILILKYQKMLKALLSNKEKLLELANTSLNENCSAVILKKLPKKLRDPRKFLILCGFTGIARDVFVSVGKFTFPTDFVIVDYERDPRVPLILGRPFLWTVRAFIDVHGEEMILRDGDERLSLNVRHDTSSYSNQPKKESINMINIYNDSYDIFDPERDIILIKKLINLDSTKDLPPPHNINPLSGSTTSSSPDQLLEEFADELALITFPSGSDDLPFDIKSDLREMEYLLNRDPTKEMDSILEDSIDESNLENPNVNLFDTIPEMVTDEHALDYSSLPLYDDYNDDLDQFEFDNDDAYNDPFDSKGEKTKESKLLIDELDLPRSSDFLPSLEYDSFLFEDFFEVDALPLTDNEDKIVNLGILILENLFEITTRVAPNKNVKKIARSHASLILKDFNPPLYELPFHKEVLGSKTLLSFSFKNEEKVFKPGILTSKGGHTSLLMELSHRGPKVFKVIKILKSPMEIFPCSFGEDIRILDVLCLHFYPP
nr:reverse transcriptase domain-containing protein [Tanacetum cinerariifolium]